MCASTFVYVYEGLACMYIYVPCICLLPKEVRESIRAPLKLELWMVIKLHHFSRPLSILKKKMATSLYLFVYLSYLFIWSCVFVWGHACAVVHIRTAEDDLRSWFLPSSMWVLRTEPRLPGLVATAIICWTFLLTLKKKNPKRINKNVHVFIRGVLRDAL